ncbi:hypothetical protein ACFQ60_18680 [Streptomyces zhihengii]
MPLLVITHFHADHVAGLPGILRGRSVGAVQTTTLEEPAGQAAFVRRVAADAGVPVVRAVPGSGGARPASAGRCSGRPPDRGLRRGSRTTRA